MMDVICPKCSSDNVEKYYHPRECPPYVKRDSGYNSIGCNTTTKHHFVNICQECENRWVGPAFNHKTGLREDGI